MRPAQLLPKSASNTYQNYTATGQARSYKPDTQVPLRQQVVAPKQQLFAQPPSQFQKQRTMLSDTEAFSAAQQHIAAKQPLQMKPNGPVEGGENQHNAIVEMQREIVRLKLMVGQREQQIMEVTRERNLYKAKQLHPQNYLLNENIIFIDTKLHNFMYQNVKYQELKGKLHEFEQRFSAPVDVIAKPQPKPTPNNEDLLSQMIAVQLQEEEKQRAERHKRRHEAILAQHLLNEVNEEQVLLQQAIEESKRDTVNPDQMSYEELLALSEKLGSVARGFTREEIEGIKTVKVSSYHHEIKAKCCLKHQLQQLILNLQVFLICCPVCHDNFKVGDFSKKLTCSHEYHDSCIDPWLEKDKHCPVCKQEVILDQ